MYAMVVVRVKEVLQIALGVRQVLNGRSLASRWLLIAIVSFTAVGGNNLLVVVIHFTGFAECDCDPR